MRTISAEKTPSLTLVVLAGWCAYASGIVSIFGIVFLAAFYAVFLTVGEGMGLGTMNDLAVIVHYALALPIVLVIHRILTRQRPGLIQVATLLGLAGMLAVIVLQTLLVTGVLAFEQQIGMVIVAFMVVLSWFVITGHVGRSTDKTPDGHAVARPCGAVRRLSGLGVSIGAQVAAEVCWCCEGEGQVCNLPIPIDVVHHVSEPSDVQESKRLRGLRRCRTTS